MKKKVFLLLFLVVSSLVNSQQDNENLIKSFDTSAFEINIPNTWKKINPTTQIDILFHYKNRNFELRYISENKYYDEFINDVEQIVKSFKIKEPN